MALILVAVAFYGVFFGDRIPVGGGRGWDGDHYVTTAADVAAGWKSASTQPHLFQRMFPSLVVHAGLVVTGSARDDATVLGAFMLLNAALMLLTLWLWMEVAGRLKLSPAACWLGFLGLFVNVLCFKMAYYYPALTDLSALALGMAQVYFYLSNRNLGLALVTLVGGFTWPVAGHVGALLILFPRDQKSERSVVSEISTAARVVAAVAALGVTFLLGYLFYARGIRVAGWGPVVPAVESVYPLSLLVTAAYVFVVVSSLVPEPAEFIGTLRRIRPTNLALSLGVYLLPGLAVSHIDAAGEYVSLQKFIAYVFFLSATRPGIFLVAHLIYFGPVLLLLPFVYRSWRQLVHQWGVGAQLSLIFGLMLAVCPDTRQSTLTLPMLVVTLVLAFERTRPVSQRLVLSLGALAILMSRIWLPFNVASPVQGDRVQDGWDLSRYYDTQGSYMTEPHYVGGLALGGLVLLLLSMSLPSVKKR